VKPSLPSHIDTSRNRRGPVTVDAQRLARLLVALDRLGAVRPLTIHRTRAGRHQLAAGGWRWWAEDGQIEICGSQWTLREVLRSPYVAIVDNGGGCELIPEDGTRGRGTPGVYRNPLVKEPAA